MVDNLPDNTDLIIQIENLQEKIQKIELVTALMKKN